MFITSSRPKRRHYSQQGFSTLVFKMIHSQPEAILSKCASVIEEVDKLASTDEVLQSISNTEKSLQNENLHWLQNHAKLVHQWKIKIETCVASLDEEILYLTNRRSFLRKIIATLRIAANINAECSWCRTTKLDGDYHDEIENELDKEKFLISDVSEELETSCERVEEYLEKLKLAKCDLELVWSNKIENYNIECDNIRLNQLCTNITLRYGATRSLNRDTTCKEWGEEIEFRLNRAESLLLESYAVHEHIDDSKLRESQRKLHEQAEKIDVALSRKTSTTQNYVGRLEKNLRLVIDKHHNLENMMVRVENTRNTLKKSLKLVQTRLSNRLEKPFSEQIYDQAQNSLLAEDENIRQEELTLQQKISQLEENIKELISVKIGIERELQLKQNNSWIDGDQCPQIRSHFPSAAELSGYEYSKKL